MWRLALVIGFWLSFSALANSLQVVSELPKIDGKKDPFITTLAKHKFAQQYDFDNTFREVPDVSYYVAYHHSGLYIAIETSDDSVRYHKRGFLHGDGFKVMVGPSTATSRAAEFIEFAFSPTNINSDKPQEKYISSYNGDGRARKLSSLTQVAAGTTEHGTFFESLISWRDVYPYQPAFDGKLNLNIYFAKGLTGLNGERVTKGFSIVHDEGIWDEAIAYRLLRPFELEADSKSFKYHPNFKFNNRTQVTGNPISIKLASTAKRDEYSWGIKHKSREFIKNTSVTWQEHDSVVLQTVGFEPGVYQLELCLRGECAINDFALLPKFDVEAETAQLLAREALDNGLKNRLLFQLERITSQILGLKPYEISGQLIDDILSLKTELSSLRSGKSISPHSTKPQRRAFRSKLDGSLQPYSIKLPENFDPEKKYPLMVFLHGSGIDDLSQLNASRSDGSFIEIAPSGRDKFYAYAYHQSEIDINEAIDDVSSHFLIDKNNIFISGFSMGGYGALLTYYRNPEKFRGVAVFAGHPNLANEWLGTVDFPNFLKTDSLEKFRGKPVFIYHGEADPALDIKLMQQFSAKLESTGANVTTSFVPERGHVYQDTETHRRFSEWLQGNLAR
ncbi:alpha/beta hydrolase-fold protein [Rheinheimera baltica]|uniref:carboxylesterase family protein n=1 Tax=Rheinheimera baltica TaxID=67576 RepID=UPI00040D9165|nr:alpha/beta hydrolase-fold protein [Rheinheimera baltica]